MQVRALTDGAKKNSVMPFTRSSTKEVRTVIQ